MKLLQIIAYVPVVPIRLIRHHCGGCVPTWALALLAIFIIFCIYEFIKGQS
jgi:hypothetical protein